MIRLVMTGIVSLSLLAVAGVQQKPQQQDSQQPDQAERASKLGQKGEKPDDDQATAEQNQRTELPELFAQLDLNDQQKQQILAIYRDSDQKSQKIWDRVQDLHRQAISMEAAAIAAARLEDHDHDAHASQAVQPSKTELGSGTKENAEKRRAGRNIEENKGNARKISRREKRSADESKPSDADESKPSDKDKVAAWPELDGDLNVVTIRIGIAQPDGRVREYLLTQPNSKADPDADPTFTTHTTQLTQVWKDIHDGHEELVELEADTIVKVEAQLTEAQLQKLDTPQTQASNTSNNPNDDTRR